MQDFENTYDFPWQERLPLNAGNACQVISGIKPNLLLAVCTTFSCRCSLGLLRQVQPHFICGT